MIYYLKICLILFAIILPKDGKYDFDTSLQGQLGEYYSIVNHPKAKGVNLKIKTPKGWEIREGDRPNVVLKFVNGVKSYLVIVKDLPTFFSKSQAIDLYSDLESTNYLTDGFETIFDDVKISKRKIVTIDNYPALEYEVSGSQEQVGIVLNMKMKVWQIVYEDKVITLQGGAINNAKSLAVLNFFTEITNSVIFPDQYLAP